MTEVSAGFVRRLLMDEAKSEFEKRIVKLTFELSTAIRTQVIRNIDKTFTKTQRQGMGGGGQAGQKGSLRNSVAVTAEGSYFGVVVGAPYASIHEYGGVIKPRNAKALTIPADPRFVGKRAREFDLELLAWKGGDGKRRAALVLASALQILSGRKSKKGVSGKSEIPKGAIAFWLVSQVTMPARPYVRPAIEETLSNAKWVDRVVKATNGAGLPWSVE